MRRFLALILSLTMIVVMMGGCTSKSETTSKEEENNNDELFFVYVSPLLAHPIWLIAKEGFETAVDELGIRGDWVGPQNISPEEMAKLIETAIAQKADAIITQGLVPTGPLELAEEAGIPVLIVDSDVADATKLAYFGKDERRQAELLLEACEEKYGEDTQLNLSVMVAALNYKIAQDQINAIEEVFKKHPGGYKIVNRSESKSDKMKATTEWQNTFKAYPEVNVAINLAAEAGPACAKVVEEMKLSDKVAVYGVDDMEETIDLIRNDKIDGTIVTSFYNYGYQATYWLYQHITEGKTPDDIHNDAGTIIVTKENIDTYGDALREKVDLK